MLLSCDESEVTNRLPAQVAGALEFRKVFILFLKNPYF